MHGQLELPLETGSDDAAREEKTPLPCLALSEDTTPGDVLHWWDELVAIFTSEMDAAQAQAVPLADALARLKGQKTAEARRRAAQLREERDLIFARAEDTEFRAYALFERTLKDFAPRLLALMRAEGLTIADDDDPAITNFWDCLQRPAIEHCANQPFREIVRWFCDDLKQPSAPAPDAAPTP